jgi:membrane protein
VTVLDRAERFFRRDLWAIEIGSLPWVRRTGIQALRLSIAVASEFRYRLFDARAAGLVYTTLLSLVPFLAVMFSVLKAFGAHHVIEPVLAEALAPLGERGDEISAQIIEFVNDLQVGVLGAVGVAFLFVTAYSLISKVEEALNAIWRVRHSRVWTRKFTDYLSVVLVGPLLVFAATGVIASAESHWIVQKILEIRALGPLFVWTAKIAPFFLLSGAFIFLHKFLPNTRVNFGSALVGGITTAMLWNLAGTAFASFVASSARYSAIYSSFAIVILFLIWLYVGWLVVLVGAQVAFFHQHPTAFQSHMQWTRGSHASRERLGLSLLLYITRRYLRGDKPATAVGLTAEVNAPAAIVDELLEHFIASGILGRVDEPRGITLIRPPDRIPMTEILEVIDQRDPATDLRHDAATGSGGEDPVGDVLGRRDRAVGAALDGVTLRSLAESD